MTFELGGFILDLLAFAMVALPLGLLFAWWFDDWRRGR